jgi:GTP diphosphokinase / guanosine-3',5'-bis(diphosphate) 3'-diphosphatase
MIRFETILEKVIRYRPDADVDLLRRAYLFSAKEHKGQVRKSGEPYLVHPLEVANILADLQLDAACVTTGLLHDIVEDTSVSLETIEHYFGKEIAHLVDGLTKISKLDNMSRAEQQAENLRKMLLAMIDDIRVVLVKLADRLHNMRTLEFLARDKQVRIAQETIEIYAPIAHRLGMARIRGELEDLAFKYLEPEEYRRIQTVVEQRRARLEEYLAQLYPRLTGLLTTSGIRVTSLEGRIKRLYSIAQKLKRQKISIDQVHDLVAIRIIVEDVKDCYAALGVIHTAWKPVPGRFKDWIAIPRENMYQSIHTTVVDGEHSFEVQIRTLEMHRIAEEGIAAHWKYKEGKLGQSNEDRAFQWLKRLVEWQTEVSDSREFMDSLKLDLYPKEVYCFTPKGKVIELPRGATPIDFAYAIHTEVGNACVGAKVNGRIVPLKYQLRNGEVVDILTNPQSNPSRDWLNFVMTSKARSKIRHSITERERERSIDIGKKLFEKETDRLRMSFKKLLTSGDLQRVSNDYGFARTDDLFAAIGYGKVQPRTVLARLLPPERLSELDQEKRPTIKQTIKKALGLEDRIQVKGVDDIMVYRARCCNPVKGEDIIGFITRGKGVAVHSATCPNVPSLTFNRERMIPVSWMKSEQDPSRYAVGLRVTTEDRPGMLADLTVAIANVSTNLRDARASVDEDAHGRIELTIEVFDVKHLDRVTAAIKAVPDVIEVERA